MDLDRNWRNEIIDEVVKKIVSQEFEGMKATECGVFVAKGENMIFECSDTVNGSKYETTLAGNSVILYVGPYTGNGVVERDYKDFDVSGHHMAVSCFFGEKFRVLNGIVEEVKHRDGIDAVVTAKLLEMGIPPMDIIIDDLRDEFLRELRIYRGEEYVASLDRGG